MSLITQTTINSLNYVYNTTSSFVEDVLVHLDSSLIPSLIVIGGTAALAYSILNPSDRFDCETLVLNTNYRNFLEQSEAVEAHVAAIWPTLYLNPTSDNQKNKEILNHRILAYLLGNNIENQRKIKTCKKIINNFIQFLNHSIKQIKNDLENDESFRKLFGLKINDTVEHIILLGEETHRKGQVPLLIEFSNQVKVIYKPRSVLPEKCICSPENSLFSNLLQHSRDLATYKVLDKQDYGYCEFIENNPTENICKTKGGLKKYAQRIAHLDLVSRKIRLSDLHFENIIVRQKKPVPIDCEVVMLPKKSPSELLSDSDGIWNVDNTTNHSKNNIYWKEKTGKTVSLENTPDYLRNMIQEAIDQTEKLSMEEKRHVRECKETLKARKNRFVPIATDILLDFIKNPNLKDEFERALAESLQEWDLTYFKKAAPKIKEKFLEDCSNNDIPIFYYDAKEQIAYYDKILIGEKKIRI